VTKTPSYRDQQAELEDILIQMQADDVDVDDALKMYDQAVKLIDKLEARLNEAQNHVEELKARQG
jgi:exodeoxyribonuclease VII small subunit